MSAIPLKKRLRYMAETALVYILYGVFRVMPLDAASATGGWIVRTLGPPSRMAVTADRNLRLAFPEKTAEERKEIMTGMWDNIGRTAAEYAHLDRIWKNVALTGGEYIAEAKNSEKAAIFFAAHLANWEINSIGAMRGGLKTALVYRKPNNPWVDSLLRHARAPCGVDYIEKGAQGAKEMFSALRQKKAVGVLIDQRLNGGIPIPFFGHDAMTAHAIGQLALKFDCPVYASRMERVEGTKFRMTVVPLKIERTGDDEKDTREMMISVNNLIESWVRMRPEQWLWIYHRWPESVYEGGNVT